MSQILNFFLGLIGAGPSDFDKKMSTFCKKTKLNSWFSFLFFVINIQVREQQISRMDSVFEEANKIHLKLFAPNTPPPWFLYLSEMDYDSLKQTKIKMVKFVLDYISEKKTWSKEELLFEDFNKLVTKFEEFKTQLITEDLEMSIQEFDFFQETPSFQNQKKNQFRQILLQFTTAFKSMKNDINAFQESLLFKMTQYTTICLDFISSKIEKIIRESEFNQKIDFLSDEGDLDLEKIYQMVLLMGNVQPRTQASEKIRIFLKDLLNNRLLI